MNKQEDIDLFDVELHELMMKYKSTVSADVVSEHFIAHAVVTCLTLAPNLDLALGRVQSAIVETCMSWQDHKQKEKADE